MNAAQFVRRQRTGQIEAGYDEATDTDNVDEVDDVDDVCVCGERR